MSPEDRDSNPYRSPLADLDDLWGTNVTCSGKEGEVRCELVRKKAMYRLLQLGGRVNALIEWNARWPFELVRVNGRVAARQHAVFYCPRFRFNLACCHKSCLVVVEVRMSRLRTLNVPLMLLMGDKAAFRLSFDNALVYSEGKWETPVPATQS